MHFNIITLFPEMFSLIENNGIISGALRKKISTMDTHNLRDFVSHSYGSVDDAPYGGGAGMVIGYIPLEKAILNIAERRKWQNKPSQRSLYSNPSRVILYLTPSGEKLSQEKICHYATLSEITIVCGRYEGIDQRFVDHYVDQEVSIGDFVLSGGEPAALCLIDAIVRWLPGTLGNPESLLAESFSPHNDGILDYPNYTRPETVGDNQTVPSVLMSGNHKKIALWRRYQSLKLTSERRPNLMSHEHNQEKEELWKLIQSWNPPISKKL